MSKHGGSIQQTGTGGDENGLMILMGQMMRLPVMALVYSFEIFIRTMKEMQRVADQSFDAVAGDLFQKGNDPPVLSSESATGETGTDLNNQSTREEESVMWDDQDLSGDDLKYVSYSILFTKRDLEATLEEEKQDLVSYSTNGGSYGGLKIAHFMKSVSEGTVERPPQWKNSGNNYPPGATGDYITEFPTEDERYITFIYSVDRRIPRSEKDYDRDQIRALQGIKEGIDLVGSKIS
ncbi:MAG TPA: hypothetical protein VN643_18325 [Pyrinomonadaceae bacterium]|nr:hypothetical protein [Pyrinomonadaceae bacterium]